MKEERASHPILSVSNLNFSYSRISVLKGLSLDLINGETVTIIGTSGSGKSTLFRLLAGLEQPKQGNIKAPHLTYMMQDDLLLPWRTVEHNICLLAELKQEEIQQELTEILEEVGLTDVRKCYPKSLSGGMRKRVSLARALTQKTPILLLDEPFASLDISTREQLFSLIEKVKVKHNLTILMTTHDFRDALTLSDRIALLDGGKITTQWKIPRNLSPAEVGTLQEEMRQAIKGNQ